MKDQTGNHELVLPKGWIAKRLGSLAEKITKGATPTTYGFAFQNTGINFIKVQNVSDGAIDLTSITDFISEEAHQNQRKSILNVNDVLFSIAGTIGETAIVKQQHLPANTNQAFAIISGFSKLLLPKYLEFQLRSFVAQKTKNKARGGAMNNVSLDDLKNLKLLLPPLAEQHRIVAKIEALFSELDKGIESFKSAREQLKIYRQALLKHAFSGKLTEQWRAENQGKLESAEALLQRIQTERQQRYQHQLKDWEDKSPSIPLLQRGKRAAIQQSCAAPTTIYSFEKKGEQTAIHPACPSANTIPPFEKGGAGGISKPKPPKTLPPLTADELAELPKLPASWGWAKYGDICEIVRNGISEKPIGEKGTPIFRISAVRPLYFDMSDIRYIDNTTGRFDSYYLEKGDLVFTRYNGSRHYVGVCAEYKSDEKCLFPDKLIQTRVISKNSLMSSFLEKALNCGESRRFLESRIRTTAGQSGVSGDDIKQTPVPICAVEEQNQIVEQLESQLTVIDQLEQTITTALQQAEALRQSILKKAFSGQLVPQDPNDEPASVLLERIRAENAQADKHPARRRGKTA